MLETRKGWVLPHDDAIVNMQDCLDAHDDKKFLHLVVQVKSNAHLVHIFKICASIWAPFVEHMEYDASFKTCNISLNKTNLKKSKLDFL